MDSNTLERLILKACLLDRTFLSTLTTPFLPEYMDDSTRSKMYSFISEHYKTYSEIPQRSMVIANCDASDEEFQELDSIDFDVATHYNYLFDETNKYLKEQALKKAILQSVDIIQKKDNLNSIRSIVDGALSKDLKIDLGLDYFVTVPERLNRIFTTTVDRVPTYYPILDEYMNGGTPPYTLSIYGAAIHGFKSCLMSNLISRQVLHGKNCALASMEMSEDMFAQRFDAIFSKRDINRIYQTTPLKAHLFRTLKALNERTDVGKLHIKQFPTGSTTVIDIRNWIRELQIRGIKIDIIYADYINLMKPSYASKGDLYSDVKKISEELRALAFEFKVPVVSVTQLNREGMRIDLRELDFTFIAESIALAATADFIGIIGSDEDAQVYESEVSIKIAKNRLGGRIGDILKFYVDTRTLGIYDTTELDDWLNDASETGDERTIAEQPEPEHRGRQQGRGGRR